MKHFFGLLLLLTAFAKGQQPVYSSKLLPDSLKKDAAAVYQMEEMIINIRSVSELSIREHTIVTVLTKKGLRHTVIQAGVNKFQKLDEAGVKVYNDEGVEIARYKKKDFKLEGIYSDMTLASDDKVYILEIPTPPLPFTIEYDYTTNLSGYISLPSWYFGNSQESIIKSRFVVKTNEKNPINYKAYNIAITPSIIKEAESITYTWEVNNQAVLKSEENSYGSRLLPRIDLSPLQFSYDDKPGTTKSWKEFGMWRYPFYTDANPFSPERINFIKTLVKDAKTEREKISILYKYLQNETRYVNIAYGIGGLKPFPVSFVETKKYGDCKALSNYMKHLLLAVGIKAYTASIYAGPDNIPFDPGFVTNRSNHIIVCVPMAKDTMWLECTSKDNAPGILGAFTENRNALLITENGGVLANTPKSRAENNQWKSHTSITLYEDGSAVSRSRIFVSGEFWTPFFYLVSGKSKDDIKKFLVQQLQFKTPDDLEVKILNDSADGHNIEMSLAYSQYYDFKTGSKYFLPGRPYKLNDEEIKPAETRTTDYLFDFPYTKTDSTVFYLPGNFKPESMPADARFNKEFVDYERKLKVNEAEMTLTLSSRLVLTKHIIPPALYNSTAKEFELIRKDENQKLVLKKE